MTEQSGIHPENPFVAPAGAREPARQLRGRLVAGVTIWTAEGSEGPVGLTVSSVMVAEGEPSYITGLLNDTTDVFEAIRSSERFVIHILGAEHKRLSERFAGLFPSPGGLFADLSVQDSIYGPVLTELSDRAYCRLVSVVPAGFQHVVLAGIDTIELGELNDPLVRFRGTYRGLTEP